MVTDIKCNILADAKHLTDELMELASHLCSFTPYRMASGRLVLVLQEPMEAVVYTQLTLTVVNGLDFRNFSRPRLSVKSCASVPSSKMQLVSLELCRGT